ncbi:MAG: hypothetical protein E7262_11255 [Lachnospiraceae bacterium]|nr:hypothetical protein [Lachnospiraceae bacterium]
MQVTCLARECEGERILEILESSASKGTMELLYTRRPNAYLSYKKESDDTKVFVIKENEQIIATIAEIIRKVYIGGEVKKIAYVCGLKKDINYKGNVNWGKVFFRSLVRDDIDGYFCSVLSDNKSAIDLFEKKRKNVMMTELLGEYRTYLMTPYFKFRLEENSYLFKRASKCDEQQIIKFLNEQGRKKEFFPVIEHIEQFTNLRIEDFYVLKNGNEIIAVGALWNQVEYRQYIVKKYNGVMKIARCLNIFLRLLGYIQLPKENENIDFPMLSFFISKDDNEEYYKIFLNNLKNEMKKGGMFVIGTVESSFNGKIYNKLRNIHFDTRIYSIDFIAGKGKKVIINKNKLWLECGLL